jgi:hypothetical protein
VIPLPVQLPWTDNRGERNKQSPPTQAFLQYMSSLDGALRTPIGGDIGSAWATYTPGVSSGGGAITTLGTCIGRFKIFGKTMLWDAQINVTTVGTANGLLIVLWPPGITAQAFGVAVGRENVGNGKMMQAAIQGVGIAAAYYDNTAPVWVNGNQWLFSAVVEIV